MKIVFIGTVEFSKAMLEKLISLKADIAGVMTKRASAFNSDFSDLSNIAKQNGIPFKHAEDINTKENIEWIKGLAPDIILCLGFSDILSNDVLLAAPRGVVGFHPARLPLHRGRHPIVWALALGLEKTASTFFFMNDKVDGGDIISQREIKIQYEDNARTLYDKVIRTASRQIEEFLPELEKNTLTAQPQDSGQTGYWKKRGRDDGKIDFKTNSRTVYNLVRALTKPYVGAHLRYNGAEVKIWEAEEVPFRSADDESGKVIEINGNRILVGCAENAVLLTKHEFGKLPKTGEYLS